jgi:hypothetical protein
MTYLPATSADFTSNATTASKESVPGATIPGTALTVVEFEFRGDVQVAATTTGVQLGVDIPSGATLKSFESHIQSSATTGTDSETISTTVTDDELEGPADMAVASATGANRFLVRGKVIVGATGGDVQLRVDTDAAAAAVVNKGVVRWYHNCCAA